MVKGGGWFHRRLTPQELLLAADAPASVIKNAPEHHMRCWVGQSFVPCKVCLEILESLADWFCARRKRAQDSAANHLTPKRQRCSTPTALDEAVPMVVKDVEATTTDASTVTQGLVACSAGKADDAEVPVELWNSEILNHEVPKEVIEANNGWRKHMRSKGMLPNMSMVERYADAKASITTLIKYTAAQ